MQKKCFKCGEEKGIDQFYKHPKMADGYLGKCKECARRYSKVRRIESPEAVHAIDRKRQTAARIRKVTEHTRKWRIENPEKYQAQVKLNNGVRAGKVIKPKQCEVCSKESRLHAHHEDYSKPFLVVWICPECHGQIQ